MKYFRCKGSITVEASFIVVFVNVILIGLVYIILCRHDITLFRARVNEAALLSEKYLTEGVDPKTGKIDYGSFLADRSIAFFTGESSEKTGYLSDCIKEINSNGYLAGMVDVSVENGFFSTKVTMSVSFTELKLPFFSFNFFGQDTSFWISEFDREEKALFYRAVTSTLRKIKGVNDLIEKVKELLSIGGTNASN